MKQTFVCTLVLLAMWSLTPVAQADLVITEVMSTSGAPAPLTGQDWWELTNNGTSSVSLQGYEWEDNAPSGPGGATAIFGNINIGAGESIIIHQGSTANGDTAFRATWSLAPTVQVLFQDSFTGNNPFSGLSSAGDEVNLYNNLGQLVASVSFGASTTGVSFEWDGDSGASLGLSVNGENGAYTATYGGIGSPGFALLTAIPEPTGLVVLGGASLLGLVVRRRRPLAG